MESSVFSFRYDGRKVRTIEESGEVWFVAVDVCRILGYSNPTESLRALEDDEKRYLATFQDTLRNSEGIYINPMAVLVSESGLYTLIMRSNKPKAKEFSRWVRREVLPSIRKTGSYELPCGGLMLPERPAVDMSKYETEPVPESEKVLVRIGGVMSVYVPMTEKGYRLMRELCEICRGA